MKKVKPIKVKKVKRELAKDPVKTEPKADVPKKIESVEDLKDSGSSSDASQEKNLSEYPHLIGGSWYRLSNKKKVQGREKALAAEKALE